MTQEGPIGAAAVRVNGPTLDQIAVALAGAGIRLLALRAPAADRPAPVAADVRATVGNDVDRARRARLPAWIRAVEGAVCDLPRGSGRLAPLAILGGVAVFRRVCAKLARRCAQGSWIVDSRQGCPAGASVAHRRPGPDRAAAATTRRGRRDARSANRRNPCLRGAPESRRLQGIADWFVAAAMPDPRSCPLSPASGPG
jgi:hypothetical protein